MSLSALFMMSVISTSVGLAPARLMALFRMKFSNTLISFQSLGKALDLSSLEFLNWLDSRSVLSIDKPKSNVPNQTMAVNEMLWVIFPCCEDDKAKCPYFK